MPGHLQNREDEQTHTKDDKEEQGFNITGVILHCLSECTANPVMPSWKKRKISLEMGLGRGGKERN
jgi:hypothetical protein